MRISIRLIAAVCVSALALPAAASAEGFVPTALEAKAATAPNAVVPVIVTAKPGIANLDLRTKVKAFGTLEKSFGVIDAVAAKLTGAQLLALAQLSSVLSITPDSPVVQTSVTSGTIWPQATGVSSLAGGPAAGTIAVVDSGVDPSAAHVVASVDFTGSAANADDDGHGSLVAGLASQAAGGAGVVSLRVVDSTGAARTSDVIAAADWIFQHRAEYGIKVANFSLRSSAPNSAFADPLDAAVRHLWLTGTVVVTSAGNDGAQRMLYAPANDPFVITVGASDIADTVGRADDGAAPWSSYGYTGDGFAKPELAAPGRWMSGPVPAASTLATTFPDRILAPGIMWMSGTSFSAPVVSGIAAQLLALHPKWSPDDVKGALMLTATTAPLAPSLQLGVGEVDAAGAAAVTNPPNPNKPLKQFVTKIGTADPQFDAARWAAFATADPLWAAASWTDASWTNASWTNASWTNASWTNASWTDASWTNASWTNASWTNASWTNASWTNASWTNGAAAP